MTAPAPPSTTDPAPPTGGRRRRRTRRVLLTLFVVMVLLVGLFYGAGGWYFSGLIHSETLEVKDYPPEPFRVERVVSGEGGGGTITLDMGEDPADRSDTEELAGIFWEGGYAQASPATSVEGTLVTRTFRTVEGQPPAVGDEVEVDGWFFPEDPEAGLGLPFSTVGIDSPLGTFPAWEVAGTDTDTWAIFTHGKGATPREALRAMSVVTARGLHMLAITYRNDADVPPSPDGIYGYGSEEVEELAAAVDHAKNGGARRIVLFGFSMGGAITLRYLLDGDPAPEVRGAVLDAPASDIREVIDLQADEERIPVVGTAVPESLEDVALWLAERRFGVDYDDLDYVARAESLGVPVLLLQGGRDETVPQQVNDALAAANPDRIRYETFPDAGHVRAWNSERARYETLVRGFLVTVVPDGS